MDLMGIYYHESSFWHKIDPRSKIIIVLGITLLLFFNQGIRLILFYIVTMALYRTSKLPWNLEWKVILKFKWLLLILFCFNLLIPFQSSLLLTLGFNFVNALTILLRLSIMLLLASWLSYVTKPMVLVEGLTRLMKPLEWLFKGLDIPLIMGLVVRFIPELFYESEKIIVAQKIRGIKPGFTLRNSQGWIKSTIIPIFLGCIRKAAALAVAMEARGYRPGIRRGSIEQLRFRAPDYVIIGLSLLLILIVIVSVLDTYGLLGLF